MWYWKVKTPERIPEMVALIGISPTFKGLSVDYGHYEKNEKTGRYVFTKDGHSRYSCVTTLFTKTEPINQDLIGDYPLNVICLAVGEVGFYKKDFTIENRKGEILFSHKAGVSDFPKYRNPRF